MIAERVTQVLSDFNILYILPRNPGRTDDTLMSGIDHWTRMRTLMTNDSNHGNNSSSFQLQFTCSSLSNKYQHLQYSARFTACLSRLICVLIAVSTTLSISTSPIPCTKRQNGKNVKRSKRKSPI